MLCPLGEYDANNARNPCADPKNNFQRGWEAKFCITSPITKARRIRPNATLNRRRLDCMRSASAPSGQAPGLDPRWIQRAFLKISEFRCCRHSRDMTRLSTTLWESDSPFQFSKTRVSVQFFPARVEVEPNKPVRAGF